MFVNENKVSPRKEKTNKAWKQNKGYNIIDFVGNHGKGNCVCLDFYGIHVMERKKVDSKNNP